MVSVAKDNTVHFWNLPDRTLIEEMKLPSAVETATYNRNTDFLAVALHNGEMLVIDCGARSVIRRFKESEGAVRSLCFNDKARWLFVADDRKQLRVYDVPNSGRWASE